MLIQRRSLSSRPMTRLLAWLGFGALMVLHHDFWRAQEATLYFGWLPEDLVYRLAWIGAAWIYLLCFERYVWKER